MGAGTSFDARHNYPRKGRILMARGRDATDVALTNAFGRATLTRFSVYTDEDRLGFVPVGTLESSVARFSGAACGSARSCASHPSPCPLPQGERENAL